MWEMFVPTPDAVHWRDTFVTMREEMSAVFALDTAFLSQTFRTLRLIECGSEVVTGNKLMSPKKTMTMKCVLFK